MVWVPLIEDGPAGPGNAVPGAITNENEASILSLIVVFSILCALVSSHVVMSATWLPWIVMPWMPGSGIGLALPVIWPNFEKSMLMSIGVVTLVWTTAACVPLTFSSRRYLLVVVTWIVPVP